MKKQQKKLLTSEGLKELKKELEQLVKVKRPQAIKRIALAREAGDLTENSEYADARESLAFIDGRIAEIEEVLQGAKTIRKKRAGKLNKVGVGCKVHVHFRGKEEIFTIVGEWEADPAEKKISHQSPLGKALLGKKVGDEIEVDAPAGKLLYKILRIESI